jgi:hypothetical protein
LKKNCKHNNISQASGSFNKDGFAKSAISLGF